MARKRGKLGEILYRHKLISKENLVKGLSKAKSEHKRLGEALVSMGVLSEDVLTKALGKQFGMKYVDVSTIEVSQNVKDLVPEDMIRKHNIIPLSMDDGVLQVVITDPLDLDTLDMLRFRLNADLECCIGSPSKVSAYLTSQADEVQDDFRSSIDATAAELAEMGHTIEAEIRRAESAEEEDDAPVIRLVNLIIDESCRMGASDIHIEPMSDRVRVRYRIDGVCIERDNIPKSMQAPVCARIKIMSGMDIGERRLPQDGRIKRMIDDSNIDFRVSALPGYHGESTVLRILRPESVNVGIQALGFEASDYERFQNIIKRPNGIFLVTGPTGSGKTTTLYSALKVLNRSDRKIITAEDPVEYNVMGINQCQVRTDIGFTFSSILRSMLRQAPDVILVGEIRDGEVADIAIQAALTGHLVFSTLHTNDATSAITRLIDMGVKPFLVASSIQAVMAQRLVRVICSNCKEIDENPDPHFLRLLNITPDDIARHPIHRGKGCPRCQNTGFKGRIAIFEMLEMNNNIRELAFAKAPSSEVRKAAIAGGMKTLLMDGRLKVFRGVTTPQEVAKVSQTEGLVIDTMEEV